MCRSLKSVPLDYELRNGVTGLKTCFSKFTRHCKVTLLVLWSFLPAKGEGVSYHPLSLHHSIWCQPAGWDVGIPSLFVFVTFLITSKTAAPLLISIIKENSFFILSLAELIRAIPKQTKPNTSLQSDTSQNRGVSKKSNPPHDRKTDLGGGGKVLRTT